MKLKIIGCLFALLTTIGGQLNAQSRQLHKECLQTVSAPFGSNVSLNSTDIPAINKANYKITKGRAIIKVYLSDAFGNYPFGDQNFAVNVDLGINLTNSPNSAPTITAANSTLVFNNTSPEKLVYVDLPYQHVPSVASSDPYTNDNFAIAISPVLSNLTATSPLTTAEVSAALRVDVCFELEYEIDIRNGTNWATQLSPESVAQHNGSKQYKLTWKTGSIEYPQYELQLLRLENTLLGAPENEYDVKTNVDWTKSLSIELSHTNLIEEANGNFSYVLTIPQGSGYYVWRIRPIGNYYSRGIANNRNWGQWSSSNLTNEIRFTENSDFSVYKDAFYYEDIDEDKNYVYGRVFTEEGKTHESFTYADGMLRSKQAQSYLPSQNKTIVTQTIYDLQGRPAISVLPTPTDGQPSGFKQDFVKDPNGNAYKIENFDTDTKLNNPDAMTGDTYDYYSDNNTAEPYVPSSEDGSTGTGYPYSRSQYSTDGNSYVKVQSGVGPTHMIGKDPNGDDKVTEKYFEKASEDELLRIFGEEAPRADVVIKEYTKDPNNITSVVYRNVKTGQVLATCLAVSDQDGDGDQSSGDSDESLEGLDSENGTNPDDDATFDIEDLLDKNDFTTEGFVSTSQMYLVEPTAVNFSYTPVCAQPEVCGETVITNFEVSFYLYSIEDLSTNLIDAAVLGQGSAGQSAQAIDVTTLCAATGNSPITFNINPLEEGEYVFKKVLKPIGTELIEKIEDKVEDLSLALIPLTALTTILLQRVKENSDWATFYDCVDCFASLWNGQQNLTLSDYTPQNPSSPNTSLADCILQYYPDLEFKFEDLSTSLGTGITTSVTYTQNPSHYYINYSVYAGTSCEQTGSLDFPVQDKPLYSCESGGQFEFNGVYYNFPPFVEYFALTLEDFVRDVNTDIEDVFPGYNLNKTDVINYLNNPTSTAYSINDNDFNKMVWHMMFDKYVYGQIKRVTPTASNVLGLEYYDEDAQTPAWVVFNPSTHLKTQYNCNDLWKCWASLIDSYEPLLDAYANGDVFPNPADNYANSIDEANGGNSDEHNNALLENMPWIVRLFLGGTSANILSNLRDPNDPDYQGIDLSAANLEIKNVSHLFLECSGYKIASIIDPRLLSTPYPPASATTFYNDCASVINSNYTIFGGGTVNGYTTFQYHNLDIPHIGNYSITAPSDLFATGANNEVEDYFLTRSSSSLDSKDLPYTFSPIYAFKYFEYFDGTPTNGCKACEVQFCYEARDYQSQDGFCGAQDCTNGHDVWSSNQRYVFYQCVKRADVLNNPPMDNGEIVTEGGNPIDCEQAAFDYAASFDAELALESPEIIPNPLIRGCYKACIDRKDEFRAKLIYALEQRCYVIGGCTADGTSISFADIDYIVEQLVADCAGQCQAELEAVSDVGCNMLNGTNLTYCDLRNGTPCQLFIIEQMKAWDFDLDLPNAMTPCTPSPEYTNLIDLYDNHAGSAENPMGNCNGPETEFSSEGNQEQNYSPVRSLPTITVPNQP